MISSRFCLVSYCWFAMLSAAWWRPVGGLQGEEVSSPSPVSNEENHHYEDTRESPYVIVSRMNRGSRVSIVPRESLFRLLTHTILFC